MRRDDVRAVQSALLRLTPRLREVLVLCDLNDVSYAEAAATLGVPIGTVRSRLSRARDALAQRLERADRRAPVRARPREARAVSCATFRERCDRDGAADAHGDACPSCRGWLERQRRAQAALARLAGTLDGAGAPPRVEAGAAPRFPGEVRAGGGRAGALRPRRRGRGACVGDRRGGGVPGGGDRGRPRSQGPAGATRSVADARPAPATRVVAPSEAPVLSRPSARNPRRGPKRPPRAAAAEAASRARTSATLAASERIGDGTSSPVEPAAVADLAQRAPRRAHAWPRRRAGDRRRPGRSGHARLLPAPAGARPVARRLRAGRSRAAARGRDAGRRPARPGPGSGERVEAEVLVGPDGVARGIRLARPRR